MLETLLKVSQGESQISIELYNEFPILSTQTVKSIIKRIDNSTTGLSKSPIRPVNGLNP